MSSDFSNILIWLAVLWPLLLALPALHQRLPFPRHLAVLPAAFLVLFSADSALTVPWLLFGTSFSLHGGGRWILVAIVMLWLLTATLLWRAKHPAPNDYFTTLFLLTLSGNVGLILAADLVTFFCFSTLMSYGFYGLLIHGGNGQVHRAGRLYLICLIVADLALFEALLLAASNTENLQFLAVHQAMSNVPATHFYLGLVLTAFMLKAGIWPLSLWLSTAFSAISSSRALLLVSIPVAAGLLGMLRWLPVGKHSFDEWGLSLQIIGVAGMLYAAFRFYTARQIRLLPAYGATVGSGLFMVLLGVGLTHPSLWHDFAYLANPYIAVSVLFLVSLSLFVRRAQHDQPPDTTFDSIKRSIKWVEKKIQILAQQCSVELHRIHRLSAIAGRMLSRSPDTTRSQKLEKFMDGWSARMIMVVMLGLLLTWLMI